MGSFLVGMRSLRVSPRRSVASRFYCSVNRAGKKMVYATHVGKPRNFGCLNQKRLCRKALGARCQLHHTGYSSEKWGGRLGVREGDEEEKWMKENRSSVSPRLLKKTAAERQLDERFSILNVLCTPFFPLQKIIMIIVIGVIG